jgi:hypothetical protein
MADLVEDHQDMEAQETEEMAMLGKELREGREETMPPTTRVLVVAVLLQRARMVKILEEITELELDPMVVEVASTSTS